MVCIQRRHAMRALADRAPPPQPRALRSAALGGAATLAAAGAVAWRGAARGDPVDARVRDWLRDRHHPHVHALSQVVAVLGSIPVVLATSAVGAAVLERRRGVRGALPVLVSVGSAIATQTLIKELVCRERSPRAASSAARPSRWTTACATGSKRAARTRVTRSPGR